MPVPRAVAELVEAELSGPDRAELSRLLLGASAQGADMVLATDPDAVPATIHERIRAKLTGPQVEVLMKTMGPAPPGPRPHPRRPDDPIASLYGARVSVDEIVDLAGAIIGSDPTARR